MGLPQHHQGVNQIRANRPRRQRYDDHMNNKFIHHSVNRPSVFSRISWPHHHKYSQKKGRFPKTMSKFPLDGEATNRGAPRDEGGNNTQNSKTGDLEKPAAERPKQGRQCLRSERPICRSWVFCRSCSQRGHIQYHCEARWRQTSKHIQTIDSGFEKTLDPNQVSSKTNPIYTSLIDTLPQIAMNTASSPPDTELQVGPRVQNPTQALQQQASAPNSTLVEISATAGSSQLESVPNSKLQWRFSVSILVRLCHGFPSIGSATEEDYGANSSNPP
jgi:hypothetical protein